MRKYLTILSISITHAAATVAANLFEFETASFLWSSPSRFYPLAVALRRVIEFPLLWVSRALDPQQFYYAYVMVPQSILWGLAIYFGVKRVRRSLSSTPVSC